MSEILCPSENRKSKDYWDWRVRSHRINEERMIWYGDKWKWDAVELMARKVLNMFSECSVMEVACGYGRHAEIFRKDRYYGFDFSDEMINLAREKYPGYNFQVKNADTFKPTRQYDIIFGVMAMGMVKNFSDYAKIAIIEIGPHEVSIKFKNLS